MYEYLNRNYRLTFSSFDQYDQLSPFAILDLFQDIAGEHADYIGVGYEDVLKKNLAWVVVRTQFDVISLPKEYSNVKVVTWPKPKGKIDFDREYEVYDENDNLLIKGISKWCLIDLTKRRIALTRDIDYSIEPLSKTNYPNSISKIDSFDINGFNEYDNKTSFNDVDHNGHVNNIAYCRYITNAIRLSKEDKIKTFSINYEKELKLDQEFKIFYLKEGKFIKIKGVIKETNETSFVSLIELF